MSELKPCPFCGSAGKITEKQAGGGAVLRRVECSDEDCDGTCAWYKEDDAITAWNTRYKDIS